MFRIPEVLGAPPVVEPDLFSAQMPVAEIPVAANPPAPAIADVAPSIEVKNEGESIMCEDNGLAAVVAAMNHRRHEGDDCGAEKVAVMNAGFDGVNHNINASTVGLNHNINSALTGITTQLNNGFGGQRDLDVMQKLGNIEGDVWKAEGQVQLALAQSTAQVSVGQALTNKYITDAIAASLASQGDIKQAVAQYGTMNLSATKDAQFAVTTATRDEGDKTRALIVQLNTDNLNRLLTVADLDRRDATHHARAREIEVNVTQSVAQTQTAINAQSQQQQQLQALIQLSAVVSNLANDIQVVRQGQTIFNSGTMAASGTQAAANTKVN